MTQEIERLSQRLRLSQGDLLGLAREVAQNANLRSIDNLSEMQHATLVQYLTLLARPAEPRRLLHFAA